MACCHRVKIIRVWGFGCPRMVWYPHPHSQTPASDVQGRRCSWNANRDPCAPTGKFHYPSPTRRSGRTSFDLHDSRMRSRVLRTRTWTFEGLAFPQDSSEIFLYPYFLPDTGKGPSQCETAVIDEGRGIDCGRHFYCRCWRATYQSQFQMLNIQNDLTIGYY